LPPTSTDTDIITATSTLPAAPTETIICDLSAAENIAGVDAVFYTQNGLSYIECLGLCKTTPACVSMFWFGDVTDEVITCRLINIPAKDAINYDTVGEPDAFTFSDRDCPLVNNPGW
jgi:hypothetical protein